MNNDSGKLLYQQFRRPSSPIVNIPTVIDPRTGERIVLWEDIQSMFNKAESIWNGRSLVMFMKDENLKQGIPERIAYHPGIVLDVVVEDNGQVDSIREAANLSQIPSTGRELKDYDDQLNKPLATLASADIMPNPYLFVYPEKVPHDTQSSTLTHNSLYSTSLHPIMSEQGSSKQSIDQHLNQLQDQIVQMQKTMDDKFDKTIRMRQQARNRLTIIQNRVEAILTQIYELHEYPIPRLFIVLPKAVGLRDKFKSPFSDQFRLYFLCECGTHTMSENSNTPHEIHMAKHEGYDLEQPTKFFERYGSYVLTLMQMIKYGIVAAGLFVPPLANFKIVDELDTTQKHLEYVKNNIAPLVDNTIGYQKQQ
ncbi:hypothetical protein BGZ65_005720 [Modicella reniformis]|uniref:Uncharacterized protein n=1 Tax=Modicella reniformis TaxID=1440133 RepID=A0A9P6MGT5_9FUNG|nr:hypothetical protein BGZ65_005720 [Modicella reniformis]